MNDCKACGKKYDLSEFDSCPYCGEEDTEVVTASNNDDENNSIEMSPQQAPVSKLRFVLIGLGAVVLTALILTLVFFLDDGDITVPDKYQTIQEAIDAAEDGDVIVVDIGVYKENIDFRGKNITLTSTDPDNPTVVDGTIIDGGRSGAVVSFRGGEGEGAILRGFTITRGNGLLISGGSSPRIEKNSIEDNEAEVGAGIAIFDSSPWIIENTIIGNNGTWGGGIYIEESSPVIEGNRILRNRADYGSGIVIYSNSSPIMSHNTISDNSAEFLGGGLAIAGNSAPLLEGNIITYNEAFSGGGIYIEESEPQIEDNLISANIAIHGGGIFLHNCLGMALLIAGNEISDNLAHSAGGGLYVDDSRIVVENNTLVNNIAQGPGGGFFVKNSAVALFGNVFEYNRASNDESGGAVWLSGDSQLDLEVPDSNIYTGNDPDDIFES